MKIPFNIPPCVGSEESYIKEAIKNAKLSGDGSFNKKCQRLLEEVLPARKVLLTPSCTAALEMAAILLDIKAGDEVIMPSFTFVSTANAFVLRGAKIVFVDVERDSMNISVSAIEKAISDKTKAIVCVHYAGVACAMDELMLLAKKYQLFVVEDAAQAIDSYYKGKPLGTIGHMGCFSFHETKNLSSGGEGGALIINDERYVERAEIIREKGTNRSQFFRGQVDKYSWVDLGSSYLPSELQAAYLYAQLNEVKSITQNRLHAWYLYYELLGNNENFELATLPDYATNNAHMFYIKVASLDIRTSLINYLSDKDIAAVFHYVPLHSSSGGHLFSRFNGEDTYTTSESEKLLRLPLYYGIKEADVRYVAKCIHDFFN